MSIVNSLQKRFTECIEIVNSIKNAEKTKIESLKEEAKKKFEVFNIYIIISNSIQYLIINMYLNRKQADNIAN